MTWPKKIIDQLRKDWIKYGFETVAIVVGILGAFALGNWHENRIGKQKEIVYLQNMKNDLERQLSIIESQRKYELSIIGNCDTILDIIHHPPYDLEKLNNPLATLGRKSFVINNPVFEDLKYSGNLSLITNIELRNAMLQFYQYLDYVETVFANNNHSWADGTSSYIQDASVADLGLQKEMILMLKNDMHISFHSKPFMGADRIIQSQLENDLLRFNLHNRISHRSKVSNIHLSLLKDLDEKNQLLIEQINSQLENR